MPSDRSSLVALRNLIAEADLILRTTPELPENHTACCRENLRAALAMAEDLIEQQRITPGAVLGSKSGSATAASRGPEYFRELAAKRRTKGGGRPRTTTE
jgi:hypothetical protein